MPSPSIEHRDPAQFPRPKPEPVSQRFPQKLSRVPLPQGSLRAEAEGVAAAPFSWTASVRSVVGYGFVQVPLQQASTRGKLSSSSSSSSPLVFPAEPRPDRAGTPLTADVEPGSGYGWGSVRLSDFRGGQGYMMPIYIGSPAQTVYLTVDTASRQLWVNPNCGYTTRPTACSQTGKYNPIVSNTSQQLHMDFSQVYGSGAVQGSFYEDMMVVSNFYVPNYSFGVANDSRTMDAGVMGLAPSTQYFTMVSKLYMLGYIYQPIFSLGLGGDSDGDDYSELVFGGVNRFRYSGALQPVLLNARASSQSPEWMFYSINVTSIGMTEPDTPSRDFLFFELPMVVDAGSTLSYVHEEIASVIGERLNATRGPQNDLFVDCRLRQLNGTVDVGFNRNGRITLTRNSTTTTSEGLHIHIPYRDFIFENTPGECYLGFQPADPDDVVYVLGLTFLRGAYLVFDQQLPAIWMADYYNCGDGVTAVGLSLADIGDKIGQC